MMSTVYEIFSVLYFKLAFGCHHFCVDAIASFPIFDRRKKCSSAGLNDKFKVLVNGMENFNESYAGLLIS